MSGGGTETDFARAGHQRHIVEIAKLKPTLARGALLLLETVVIPTLLLYACTRTVGGFWGLIAVLGWCGLTVGTRLTMGQHVPSTLLLAVGALVGRTTIALVFSNVYVYLFQPIVGSLFMAALFLGSAAIGRPVTARLARISWRCPPTFSVTDGCGGCSCVYRCCGVPHALSTRA
jgi:hypothetical protein